MITTLLLLLIILPVIGFTVGWIQTRLEQAVYNRHLED